MITNEATIHQSSNKVNGSNYKQPYGLQNIIFHFSGYPDSCTMIWILNCGPLNDNIYRMASPVIKLTLLKKNT